MYIAQTRVVSISLSFLFTMRIFFLVLHTHRKNMNWQQLWPDAQDLQVLFKAAWMKAGLECLIPSWGAIGNWKWLGNGDSIFSVWSLNEAPHSLADYLVDYTYTYTEKHYSQPWSETLLFAVDHGWMQRLLVTQVAKNMLVYSAQSSA